MPRFLHPVAIFSTLCVVLFVLCIVLVFPQIRCGAGYSPYPPKEPESRNEPRQPGGTPPAKASTAVRWADDARRDESLKRAERVHETLTFESNDPQALRQAAADLAAESRWPEVAQVLARLCRLQPDNVDARQEFGSVLMGLGRWTEAIVQLEQVVAVEPRRAKAWHNLAMAQRQCGRLSGAERSFTKLIELTPEADDAYAYRGEIRLDLGDAAGAALDFERVLAADPSATSVALNLATARASLNEPERAIAALTAALEHTPQNVPVLNRLAALEMNGAVRPGSDAPAHTARAAAYCRRSLELDADQPAVRELLARAEAHP